MESFAAMVRSSDHGAARITEPCQCPAALARKPCGWPHNGGLQLPREGRESMLNALWLGFFLVAAVAALAQWLGGGQGGIFSAMGQGAFAMGRVAGGGMGLLFGTLTPWVGLFWHAE